MLYGPDFPNVKELSAALVTVVRDSSILERSESREDKRGGTGRTRDGIADVETKATDNNTSMQKSETANGQSGTQGMKIWGWVIVLAALLCAVSWIWLRKKR